MPTIRLKHYFLTIHNYADSCPEKLRFTIAALSTILCLMLISHSSFFSLFFVAISVYFFMPPTTTKRNNTKKPNYKKYHKLIHHKNYDAAEHELHILITEFPECVKPHIELVNVALKFRMDRNMADMRILHAMRTFSNEKDQQKLKMAYNRLCSPQSEEIEEPHSDIKKTDIIIKAQKANLKTFKN